MKTAIFLVGCLALCGCHVVQLTPEGREVMVVDGVSSLTTECTRLGSVVGQHKLGYDYAMTIVRNKAAQMYKADTVVINTVEGRMSPSRRVTAIAFNCSDRRTQPIQIVSPATADAPKDIFDKAKKCQAKDGVWINNQCVVQVE